MPYTVNTPNTRDWRVGEIVIHDSDRKEPYMLMIVCGYNKKTGELRTRYLNPNHSGNKVWENPKENLHDPIRFGIDLKEVPIEKLRYGELWPKASDRELVAS